MSQSSWPAKSRYLWPQSVPPIVCFVNELSLGSSAGLLRADSSFFSMELQIQPMNSRLSWQCASGQAHMPQRGLHTMRTCQTVAETRCYVPCLLVDCQQLGAALLLQFLEL